MNIFFWELQVLLIVIQRSGRQGDPLSMHLFVLYLRPLLVKLRTICNHVLDLIVAYADDISFMITDMSKLISLSNLFWTLAGVQGLSWISTNLVLLTSGSNLREIIRDASQLMWLLKPRNLTFHQKVVVLNTLFTSKLWLLVSVFSISNQAIACISSHIGNFIWDW